MLRCLQKERKDYYNSLLEAEAKSSVQTREEERIHYEMIWIKHAQAKAILRQSYVLPGREEAEVRSRGDLGEEQMEAYDR